MLTNLEIRDMFNLLIQSLQWWEIIRLCITRSYLVALTDLKHEGVDLFPDVLVCQLVPQGRFQQDIQERQPPLHADGVKGLISLCGFS